MDDEVERLRAEVGVYKKRVEKLEEFYKTFERIVIFALRLPREMNFYFGGIIGQVELLLEYPYPDPEQKDLLLSIQKSSYELLRLKNDFLDIQKIETGKFEFYAESFRLDDLLNSAVEFYKKRLIEGGKAIGLETELDQNLPVVISGDQNRIRQILFCFLDNAINFSVEGGKVVLSTKMNADNNLQISVCDYGRDRLRKSIEFAQLNDFLVTGILPQDDWVVDFGTFISQRLATLMGGKIWCESEGEGKGSTFHFTLPVKVNVDATMGDAI